MSLSNKAVREIVGYTFLKMDSDPQNWFEMARKFHAAATILYNDTQHSLTPVCFHVAGLSFELALKAIIIVKSKSFQKIHTLPKLLALADITVSPDQICTLELLSECIIWRGRYPTPKRECDWDKYHDEIQEKHIITEKVGNIGRTLVNKSRFPTQENYQTLWEIFENEFSSLAPHNH